MNKTGSLCIALSLFVVVFILIATLLLQKLWFIDQIRSCSAQQIQLYAAVDEGFFLTYRRLIEQLRIGKLLREQTYTYYCALPEYNLTAAYGIDGESHVTIMAQLTKNDVRQLGVHAEGNIENNHIYLTTWRYIY